MLSLNNLKCGLLLAVASTLALQTPVFAQGTSWSGGYLGANVGSAQGRSNVASTVGCPANGYFCTTTSFHPNIPHIVRNGSPELSDNSGIGGIQAGYDMQLGSFVIGVVADAGRMQLEASNRAGPVAYPTNAAVLYTLDTQFQTNFLLTARARLGWSFGSVLVYGTGGVAFTDLTVKNAMADDSALRGGSSSVDLKTGWAAGGGVEIALARNWTILAEYMHVDFGTQSTTASVGTSANNNPLTTKADLAADIFRGGINYRF